MSCLFQLKKKIHSIIQVFPIYLNDDCPSPPPFLKNYLFLQGPQGRLQLYCVGSVAVVCGISFPKQGSNARPLHCGENSSPLDHQRGTSQTFNRGAPCLSVSVQLLSRVWLFETPWTAARQASLSITNSQNLLTFMSMMPSNHLSLCHPLFLPPSIFPSIRVFSGESVLHIR